MNNLPSGRERAYSALCQQNSAGVLIKLKLTKLKDAIPSEGESAPFRRQYEATEKRIHVDHTVPFCNQPKR